MPLNRFLRSLFICFLLIHQLQAGCGNTITHWIIKTAIGYIAKNLSYIEFKNIPEGNRYLENQYKQFSDNIFDNSRSPHNKPLGQVPQELAGIPLNETAYNDFRQYPFLYGTISVSAEIDSVGDVILSLGTWRFTRKCPQHSESLFAYKEFGSKKVLCNNPVIQQFISLECDKQINQLHLDLRYFKSHLYTHLEQSLDEVYACNACKTFFKFFYGLKCRAFALYKMVLLRIAPLIITHIVRHGVVSTMRNLNHKMHTSSDYRFCVVTDCITGDVINIGDPRYPDFIDPEPQKEKEKKQPSLTPEKEPWTILSCEEREYLEELRLCENYLCEKGRKDYEILLQKEEAEKKAQEEGDQPKEKDSENSKPEENGKEKTPENKTPDNQKEPAENTEADTPDNFLKKTDPCSDDTRTKDRPDECTLREKEGNSATALEDLKKLNPKKIKEHPNGCITGTLDDGATVTVRPTSKAGWPTLEIIKRIANRKETTKVRYKEKR